jgi:hypothetical protein
MTDAQERLGIKGVVRVRSHPAGTIATIEALLKDGKKDEARNLIKSGKLEVETKNTIMVGSSTGKDLIVQYLISAYTGMLPYPTGINWGAIGTSNTTPATTDTQLGAETNRSAPTFAEDFAYTEAILQFFFPDAVLSNTTFYEFGAFINGTSSPNTGQIFNHALFGTPYTKVSGQDTTVEVDVTLT